MQYRFMQQVTSKYLARMPPDYEVLAPHGARWPRNWEWTYDFDDFWRDVGLEFRLLMFRLTLAILRRYAAVHRGVPEYTERVSYATVDAKDAIDAIWKKLTEYQRNGIHREDIMILVGPKEFIELCQLETLQNPVMFHGPLRYGYSEPMRTGEREISMYMLDVPVIYLPDFVGMAVVPDMTGTAKRQLVDREVRRW